MTRKMSAVRRAEARQWSRAGTVAPPAPREPPPPPAAPRKLYWEAALDDRAHWTPGLSTAFKILVSLRMSAGIWSPVSDCDEVFNYWEPLHFLLYGTGFQTWEYSPLYAIRSYAYILLHAAPVRLFQILLPHTKVTTFFYLRCFLGLVCAVVETYLYKVVCKRMGNGIGRLYILFSALAAGMFISSAAFLPSSFSMVCTGLMLGLWLDGHHFLAVLATAVSALVGWPFAAILGLPVVFSLLTSGMWKRFVCYALVSGVSVCFILILVDSHFYGKFVLAPLNIVLYNVFSETGSELYGTAPLSFYLINLGLNWNIAFPLALVCVPTSWMVYRKASGEQKKEEGPSWEAYYPVPFLNLALFLWLAVFFSQPHKVSGKQKKEEGPSWGAYYPVLFLNLALFLWLAVFFSQPHKVSGKQKEEEGPSWGAYYRYPILFLNLSLFLWLAVSQPHKVSGKQKEEEGPSWGAYYHYPILFLNLSLFLWLAVSQPHKVSVKQKEEEGPSWGAYYHYPILFLNLSLFLWLAVSQPHKVSGKQKEEEGPSWGAYYHYPILFLNLSLFLWLAVSQPHKVSGKQKEEEGPSWGAYYPVPFLNLSFFLWLAVFFPQPQKLEEERFLFPAYPLVALSAAIALDAIERLARALAHSTPLKWVPTYLVTGVVVVFALLSGARSLGLYRHFHAPFDVYMQLGERLSRLPPGHSQPLQVCVGKEWYRFPSSFFLPSHTGLVGGQPSHYSTRNPSAQVEEALRNRSEVRMGFVESEFRGLLPGRFPAHLPLPDATRHIPPDQNDANREEESHYTPIAACDYLIDLDLHTGSQREPRYAASPHWSLVYSEPFLLTHASHPLFRAFFIPALSHRHTSFAHYSLLHRTHPPPPHQ